jgi:hypothetical protein
MQAWLWSHGSAGVELCTAAFCWRAGSGVVTKSLPTTGHNSNNVGPERRLESCCTSNTTFGSQRTFGSMSTSTARAAHCRSADAAVTLSWRCWKKVSAAAAP